jgi:hypothetical protein
MPRNEEAIERMRRWGESLKQAENDELVEGEGRIELIRWANKHRAAMGIPLLEEPDPDAVPEVELYERFKALGMARVRR